MENHIIIKEDGSRLEWKTNRSNKHFCLLYHDNNKKYIFTPTRNLKCKLFMIGGGGAGGYYFGGGGGAGAAYINNNFTFEQGKTYTFSIGTGGTCDISNFDKLFNSGLSLNVYNNTTPNFNNLSFNYDDYSSMGINKSSIMQSFIVNNINITPTIFNTNTTYIWNGYIKSTKNIISIRLNSKINVFIWVNTYQFSLDNTVIKTTGVGNAQEFRNLELDPNKYYNVKIIAYNYDTTSNANFNVSFENCQFYNFNKNNEEYNVVPATDTTMTFKSISSNKNNVISCKGGGTGGYGLYNNNTNLNGGCGGGSGINKIKGISINNNPIYNGFDGAIGDYCGGGGGIISEANNNNGGEGKILNWFNETLLFGAGGNGANNNNKDNRNLGYGCGGNGGDCCYFSKSLINNNGNNGCIIIYVNDESDTIENFTTASITISGKNNNIYRVQDNSNYEYAIFRNNGIFTTNIDLRCDILVVGGGGAGGDSAGGGGGAGGLIYLTDRPINPNSYNIVIGNGGDASLSQTIARKGGDTIFDGLIAIGGGAGATMDFTPGNGGSGGGGCRIPAGTTGTGVVGQTGGTGTVDQGNNGGDGKNQGGNNAAGGGGGGAGAAGASAFTSVRGADGGIGKKISITGTNIYYAGGGGGGSGNQLVVAGSGGLGGGGNGSIWDKLGSNGINGLGGGGGGGSAYTGTGKRGGNGGSGVVIIRFPKQSTHIIEDENLTYYKDTIATKLIDESFRIADLPGDIAKSENIASRKTYFDNSLSFGSLAVNAGVATHTVDNNNMHNFIYDVLVISKIYAIAYRLLYYHYTKTCNSDITIFANSMKNAKISFTSGLTEDYMMSKITYDTNDPNTCIINFNNLFNLDNLGINNSKPKTNYKSQNDIYIKHASGVSTITGCPNMAKEVFDASINDICGNNEIGYHVPVYHNQQDGSAFNGLKLFYDNTSQFRNYLNKIDDNTSIHGDINRYELTNTGSNNVRFIFNNSNGFLDKIVLTNLKIKLDDYIADSSNINKYEYTRILLYIEAFEQILNLNPYSTLLATLKYNMFKYNAIIFNVAIQYQLFYYQNNRTVITNGAFTATTSSSSPTDTVVKGYATHCKTDINNFEATLNNIISLNINIPDQSEKTLNTIVELQKQKKTTDNIYIDNQTVLNETINTYNSEFQNYNKILYYYKIIIIIALFLVLIIFFIFTLNNIDNNTKIIIYVCIIFIIICILAYYNKFSISENFTIAHNKDEADSSKIFTDGGINYIINYYSYKKKLGDYLNKITKFITTGSINNDILQPIKVFNNTVDTVRRNKAEYYKLKKINLDNAIDLLKKSANSYYYLSIFIILSTIILLFTLILLLLNPNMLMQIISVSAIFMIILIYYVSYLINKPTRLAETKNYWANFNPSKDTLKAL